jgi:hypothetical protein
MIAIAFGYCDTFGVQVRSAGCEGDAPSLVRGATEANQGVMPMQAILH